MKSETSTTPSMKTTPKSPSKGLTAPLVTNKGCLSCKYNTSSIMTEMVKCVTCEKHFHAICRDKRGIPTKSSICPPTFLKSFSEISGHYGTHKERLGQFQYVCDTCLVAPAPDPVTIGTQTLTSGAMSDHESLPLGAEPIDIINIMPDDSDSLNELPELKPLFKLQKEILSRIELLCSNSSTLETSVCNQFASLKKQMARANLADIEPVHKYPSPLDPDIEATLPPSNPPRVMKPFTELHPEFLSDEDKQPILSFLDTIDGFQTVKSSSSTNSSRDILYFGEFSYRYGNIEHPAKPFPAEIKQVMDQVEKLYPKSFSNSCLITRYRSGANGIPQHSDNEPFISPWSDIMTLSLGCKRTMSFQSSNGSSSSSIDLPDNSLLVFSRASQEQWNHGIEPVSNSAVRYSLTFRQLAPYFINSTAIIGDSNTEKLSFGTGRKTFGKWLPGIRIKAGRIKDIPDPEGLYPFRNVVFHCGINDLRSRDGPPNIDQLAKTLHNKCHQYTTKFPKMKVHLSLLLPTRDPNLNRSVHHLNSLISSMCRNMKNISIISHHNLAFSDGSLRPELGRRNRDNGSPVHGDPVHLGYTGIIQFSQTLKNTIIKPKDGVNRNQIDNSRVKLPAANTSGFPYFNPNPEYRNSNNSRNIGNQWFQKPLNESFNDSTWNRGPGPNSTLRENIYYGY